MHKRRNGFNVTLEEGGDVFSERLAPLNRVPCGKFNRAGGRAPFHDLSVGEALALVRAKGRTAEGASLPAYGGAEGDQGFPHR
jgi:hypothetical protein